MVQLYVYEGNDRYEINLYDDEPIKLTLSAENLGSLPTIDSEFSRQFRVPANQNNSKVFKWWYEANTVDFDVTKKIKSEIHVDGLLYKTGHTRINAAYKNGQTGQIDLELVFYGQTRDFSTQVGDIFLPELEVSHLAHQLSLANVRNSWLPRTDPACLLGGGIRYIIADRGNTYTQVGTTFTANETEIGLNENGTNYTNGFYKSNHPLPLEQFTATMQVKQIIDAIFDRTDYTYSSDSVFNLDWFQELYTDLVPNNNLYMEITDSKFEARPFGIYTYPGTAESRVPYPTVIFNNAGSYNANNTFTVPETGTYNFVVENNYIMNRAPQYATPTVITRIRVNGVEQAIDSFTTPFGINQYSYTANLTLNQIFTKGDVVEVTTRFTGSWGINYLDIDSKFKATVAPVTNSMSNLLKRDVKAIDFFKAILLKFKLIMVPSKYKDSEFVVKPFVDYIGSGETFDWTDKLDESKDIVLTPLFYDQKARITFKDTPDDDMINKFHQDQFDRIYGELFFNSKNDLLNDTNPIQSIFAPTPVDQIQGAYDYSQFIIPYLSKHGTDTADFGRAVHEPITPKPRLLFWNEIAAIQSTENWYYTDGATTIDSSQFPFATLPTGHGYPRMTYLSSVPSTPTTLNLNWFREFAYFSLNGGPVGTLGESVYERYWNTYIQSLYSPLARKMTAYFTIDSQDLRNLTFDDLIFIDNSYWRPLKIYDAPLTDIATVKVDLIKILQADIYPVTADPTEDGGGIDDSVMTGGGQGTFLPGTDPVLRVYYLTTCTNPGDPIFGAYTSINELLPGAAVRVSHDGGFECWQVLAETFVAPTTTILEVFENCESCAVAP